MGEFSKILLTFETNHEKGLAYARPPSGCVTLAVEINAFF